MKKLMLSVFFVLICALSNAIEPVVVNETSLKELSPDSDAECVILWGITENADLSVLSTLPNLKELRFSRDYSGGYFLKHIEQIALCPCLESLEFDHVNGFFLPLSPLKEHPTLKRLSLHSALFWNDVQEIAALENLHSLALSYAEFENAEELQLLESIKELAISDSDLTPANIEELQYVSLPNLEVLSLENTNAKGLNFAQFTPNLVRLNLRNSNAGGSEVKSLRDIVTLEYVDLGRTNISSGAVSNLSKIAGLKEINLHATNIKGANFSSFVNLPLLEVLDLSATNLTRADLMTLQDLVQLKRLTIEKLTSTTIRSEDIAKLKSALSDCEVIH